jgi:hypothetical protein
MAQPAPTGNPISPNSTASTESQHSTPPLSNATSPVTPELRELSSDDSLSSLPSELGQVFSLSGGQQRNNAMSPFALSSSLSTRTPSVISSSQLTQSTAVISSQQLGIIAEIEILLKGLPIQFIGSTFDDFAQKWSYKHYKDNDKFPDRKCFIVKQRDGFMNFIKAVSAMFNPNLKTADKFLLDFLKAQPAFVKINTAIDQDPRIKSSIVKKFGQYLEERRDTFSIKTLKELGWDEKGLAQTQITKFCVKQDKTQSFLSISSLSPSLSSSSSSFIPASALPGIADRLALQNISNTHSNPQTSMTSSSSASPFSLLSSVGNGTSMKSMSNSNAGNKLSSSFTSLSQSSSQLSPQLGGASNSMALSLGGKRCSSSNSNNSSNKKVKKAIVPPKGTLAITNYFSSHINIGDKENQPHSLS